jgi:putative ABC transport system permease protein
VLRRLYALLLRCYPPAFRRRFGPELQFAFDAGRRRARARGRLAALTFLAAAGTDAVVSGVRERRSHRWYSPRAERDPLMMTLLSDMKYGARQMRRQPQLAALAVCTLALGIGLAVSLYAVAHGTLVAPLPFGDESRVVMLYEHAPQKGTIRGNVAPANFLDWRERTTSFAHMGALRPFSATVQTASGSAVRADGRRILGEAFAGMGLDAHLGRVFTPDDEQPGQAVVIFGHRFWRQHFGADPSLIGRRVMLDERPYTLIGVLEPVLRVPGGPVGYDEIFVPWVLTAQQRSGRMSHISDAVARIKPGVTIEQAQADIARVAAGLAQEYPHSNENESVLLVPLRDALTGEVRPALLVLVGAVTVVLLIACVNVANLLLARATARRQEMAVRAALGAGRARLCRQLLAESLVLAATASVLGLVLGYWFVGWLGLILPPDLGGAIDTRIDWRIAAAAVGMCLVTSVLAGLAPASFVLVRDASAIVREGRSGRQPSARARRGLVTVQVALAVVLLAGAGLLMRSLARLTSVDPGIRPDNVLTLSVELPRSRYAGPEQWQPFFERLLADLRALPGVTHAAGIGGLPFNENGGSVGFHVEGHVPADPNQHTYVIYRLVTPGLFETLGIPLLAGRDVSTADQPGGARVAVVNQTLATRYWPGESAVGKRVAFRGNPRPQDWITIVGVVGDTHHWSLAEAIDIQLYAPYTQDAGWLAPGQLALRTSGDPMQLAAAVRARVQAIDPLVPISDVQSMEDLVARSVAAPRFHLTLLALLSGSALVLATIGIYGLLAFSVATRTREIGVRSALGASQTIIARMVLREGLALTTAGVAAGLVVAFAATRSLEALLFEIEPHDPVTFAAIAALLLAVALLACYLPARRAARIDPLTALRAE